MKFDIYRDTACFSDKQWFVEGFECWAFSTKEDAQHAVAMFGKGEIAGAEAMAGRVMDAIR